MVPPIATAEVTTAIADEAWIYCIEQGECVLVYRSSLVSTRDFAEVWQGIVDRDLTLYSVYHMEDDCMIGGSAWAEVYKPLLTEASHK